ncbi:hypothetical protein [Legionella pneumophila]
MPKHLFYGVFLILLSMKAYSQDAVSRDIAKRTESIEKKVLSITMLLIVIIKSHLKFLILIRISF